HGCAPTSVYASPHAVDNEFFASNAAPHLSVSGRAAARASLGIADGDFVVLFAGKITRRKRPIDAVRAVASLGGRAVLVVAGSGDELHDTRQEASRLGVRACFLGFQNQRDLPRAYALADCLVLPSSEESWGLTVNEAMATGLPVVLSAAVGCGPDLVAAGITGETYKVGDVSELGDALARVRDRGGRSAFNDECRRRVAAF